MPPRQVTKSRVALRCWTAPGSSVRARTRSSAWRRRIFSKPSSRRLPKKKQAEAHVKKRQRENGGTGSAAEVGQLVAAWDMTSFNSLPREKRWGIIKDVRRKYDDLCVIAPEGMRKTHAAAKVARLQKARAAELLRCMNRAAKHAEFSKIKPCTSTTELEALRSAHEDDKDYAKALRDQIRVRVHVYGFAAKRLPKIGGGGNLVEEEAGLLRLRAELPAMVETPLPAQSTAPQPYPVHPQHAAPSPLAVIMDQKYLVSVTQAWRELAAMTSQFVFRTPRARASRAVRAPRPQPRQTIFLQDAALNGTAFTEVEVSWKVLAPLWSAAEKRVVVWYYDVDAAAAESTAEEEMMVFAYVVASASEIPGPCPKPLERSIVMEIRSSVFNDTQAQKGSTEALGGVVVCCGCIVQVHCYISQRSGAEFVFNTIKKHSELPADPCRKLLVFQQRPPSRRRVGIKYLPIYHYLMGFWGRFLPLRRPKRI